MNIPLRAKYLRRNAPEVYSAAPYKGRTGNSHGPAKFHDPKTYKKGIPNQGPKRAMLVDGLTGHRTMVLDTGWAL